MEPESSAAPLAVAVWGTGSLLTQTTTSPLPTVTSGGWNSNPSMVTVCTTGAASAPPISNAATAAASDRRATLGNGMVSASG